MLEVYTSLTDWLYDYSSFINFSLWFMIEIEINVNEIGICVPTFFLFNWFIND